MLLILSLLLDSLELEVSYYITITGRRVVDSSTLGVAKSSRVRSSVSGRHRIVVAKARARPKGKFLGLSTIQ
jgi:hypothetical protein